MTPTVDPAIDATDTIVVPFKGCGLGPAIRFSGSCLHCNKPLTEKTAPFVLSTWKGQPGYVCAQCKRKQRK